MIIVKYQILNSDYETSEDDSEGYIDSSDSYSDTSDDASVDDRVHTITYDICVDINTSGSGYCSNHRPLKNGKFIPRHSAIYTLNDYVNYKYGTGITVYYEVEVSDHDGYCSGDRCNYHKYLSSADIDFPEGMDFEILSVKIKNDTEYGYYSD